jgi:SsrA-binding protein
LLGGYLKYTLNPQFCQDRLENSRFLWYITLMERKNISTNRKALHNYEILDSFEAGIVLKGNEVKSIRGGHINMGDAHASINKEEVFLYNMHISPYEHSRLEECDALRVRKLLLHKKEIKKLMGKVKEKGLTLVPLELYFSKGNVKVKLALARGRNARDKRDELKKKDAQREMQRAFREKHK